MPPSRLRLAVSTTGDPRASAAHSGVPAGIVHGLQDLGAEVAPVRAELPSRLERPVSVALAASSLRPRDLRHPALAIRRRMPGVAVRSVFSALRGPRARGDLRRAGPLDGAVQHGCEYRLPWSTPFVTLEDSTFAQAVEAYEWPWLQDQSTRAIRRMVERQRAVYEEATACCAMSHWAAQSIVEDYGVAAERVKVVGVGCNVETDMRRREWTQPRFLFVGTDFERKNGPRVLAAFSALHERRPDARLDIVGGHPPIDASGVVAHGPLDLRLADERRRLARLYEAATCFVLPSLHEPAGIVYAEAGASGIASIGSTAGGAATIIDGAGRVVDPLDDAALLSAMEELANPETAAHLGTQAAARSKLFTWTAVAERLLRALAPPSIEVDALAEFL
jgi:glycosyltransferase involved in cell wall biosynthesis